MTTRLTTTPDADTEPIKSDHSDLTKEAELQAELKDLRANLNVYKGKEAMLTRRSGHLDELNGVLADAGIASADELNEFITQSRAKMNDSEKSDLANRARESRIKDMEARIATQEQQISSFKEETKTAAKNKFLGGLVTRLKVLPEFRESAKALLVDHIDETESGDFEVTNREEVLKKFSDLHKAMIKSDALEGGGIDSSVREYNGTLKRGTMSVQQKAAYANSHGQEAFLRLPW